MFCFDCSKESSQNLHNNAGDNQTDEASDADFQIRTVFLIGQTENNDTQDRIIEESHTYNDLIQERFLDTYNNLTLKSVMMLKWINMNCDADKGKILISIIQFHYCQLNLFGVFQLNLS